MSKPDHHWQCETHERLSRMNVKVRARRFTFCHQCGYKRLCDHQGGDRYLCDFCVADAGLAAIEPEPTPGVTGIRKDMLT